MSPSTPRNGAAHPAAGKCLTQEAFADAFMSASRTLWCIAAGVLGSREHADDVLQEAAMIALRKLDQFDPDTSLTAWVGRIVRYVALNQARRRQRTLASAVDPTALETVVQDRMSEGETPTSGRGDLLPDQACFDDDVLAALRGLDETARACLLLRTVMDLPYREISRALDIPEGTAMSHVHRARRSLRAKLKDRSGETTGCKGTS
jgi:RNA polymerase sigma-70 factor (ECF subfamily)